MIDMGQLLDGVGIFSGKFVHDAREPFADVGGELVRRVQRGEAKIFVHEKGDGSPRRRKASCARSAPSFVSTR